MQAKGLSIEFAGRLSGDSHRKSTNISVNEAAITLLAGLATTSSKEPDGSFFAPPLMRPKNTEFVTS
jgi:hypothetical protein